MKYYLLALRAEIPATSAFKCSPKFNCLEYTDNKESNNVARVMRLFWEVEMANAGAMNI